MTLGKLSISEVSFTFTAVSAVTVLFQFSKKKYERFFLVLLPKLLNNQMYLLYSQIVSKNSKQNSNSYNKKYGASLG